MERKKLYKIGAIISIILLIGLIFWYWFIINRDDVGQGDQPVVTEQNITRVGIGTGRSGVTGLFPTTFSGETATSSVESFERVFDKPIAGFMVMPNGTHVRVASRIDGNIFEIDTETLGSNRISNVTIPQVHEVLFVDNGESVIVRYYDKDTIVSVYMSAEQYMGSRTGTFLPDGIEQISTNSDGSKIFYTIKTRDGLQGVVANSDGSAGKNVWFSPLFSWTHSWGSADTITIAQKASQDVEGYSVSITQDGVVVDTLSNKKGLTLTASPTYILYTTYEGVVIKPYLVHKNNGFEAPLPYALMSDKCTISGDIAWCGVPLLLYDGTYPDDWYQGVLSFSDTLVKVDLLHRTVSALMTPETEKSVPVDITNIQTKNNSEIFFVNKKDFMLWVVRTQTTTE